MLELKYGDSKVDIDLSKAKSVKVLNEIQWMKLQILSQNLLKV